MASDEHKNLATFVKEVHSTLRKSVLIHGFEKAWHDHCENTEVLKKYAICMDKLAQLHWETNCDSNSSLATSRIKWTANFCYKYFVDKLYCDFLEKEIKICDKIGLIPNVTENFSFPIKMIDVGSCYNPFKIYEFLDVLAIDLYPANESVYQCDFLTVPVTTNTVIKDCTVTQLEEISFDVVSFCFLLEYIPSSESRVAACEKAYSLLKPGGLLIINTPDSKHVGSNCKMMKCWRYTLSCIGFNRIVYEKFKHMHSMVFRKTLCKDTAVRWSIIYKEPYMEYTINIPQDSNHNVNKTFIPSKLSEVSLDDFKQLPFFDSLE